MTGLLRSSLVFAFLILSLLFQPLAAHANIDGYMLGEYAQQLYQHQSTPPPPGQSGPPKDSLLARMSRHVTAHCVASFLNFSMGARAWRIGFLPDRNQPLTDEQFLPYLENEELLPVDQINFYRLATYVFPGRPLPSQESFPDRRSDT